MVLAAWRAQVGVGLFRLPDFRRFWTAQVVSELGSGVTTLALPLTAVLWLNASAIEMGILRALATTPVLLLALVAGVWVDRLPRRPILVAADTGRGILLLLVPLAAATGVLRIEVLWVVAFAVGILTVLFDIAATSYVPTLVERGALVQANATLQASGNAARIAGPGVAGWLVQLIGPPFAIVLDAASLLGSAALLGSLRAPETTEKGPRPGLWSEVKEGIAAVWNEPVLRAMVLATTVGSAAGAVQGAILILYATRELVVSPAALGAVLACGSAGGLGGAVLSGPLSARLGAGRALVASQGLIATSAFAVLAAPPGMLAPYVLAVAQLIFGLGMASFSVTQISLRQAMTPPRLLGRVNATRRVLVFGVQPLGALVGGALGEWRGLYTALALAAALQIVCFLATALSPLRTAREETPAG